MISVNLTSLVLSAISFLIFRKTRKITKTTIEQRVLYSIRKSFHDTMLFFQSFENPLFDSQQFLREMDRQLRQEEGGLFLQNT